MAQKSAQNTFPDGTKIPAWFSDTAKIQLKQLGKQFVITQFGAVNDSTLVQTEAIQKTIDETIEKNEFIDLSQREKEILALLVKGKSYKTIASECFISIDTVSTHVRHIYEKLHVHSKSEAVAKAINQKLV